MDATAQTGSIANFELAKVFERLSENRSTGVLNVRSGHGSKTITIDEGKVTLISEGKFQRDYLGEVLVAKKKITREDLDKALEQQKFHNTRLGETLAEMGLVSKGDIEEVLKYQMEEELCDLFSWREGTYQFTPGTAPAGTADASAVHLTVDTRALLAESAKRLRLWPDLEKYVPSSNAVFRLTERGKSLVEMASSGARRFLVHVDEGLPVQEIVRQSYLGRFSVYKTLADLVKTDHIVERDTEDMELLARDRIRSGEFGLAKAVYKRLQEKTEVPSEKQRFKEQLLYIDELEHKTKKMPVMDDTAISTKAVTVRDPIEKTAEPRETLQKTLKAQVAPRHRPVWASILVVLVVLTVLGAIAGGTALYFSRHLQEMVFDTARTEIPPLFTRVDKAVEERDYEAALGMLSDFLAEHPVSASSELVVEKLTEVKDLVREDARRTLRSARELEAAGRIGEALELVETAVDELPFTSERGELVRLEAEVKKKFREKTNKERIRSLLTRLGSAENLLLEGKPEDASAAASALLEEENLPESVVVRAKAVIVDAGEVKNRQEALLGDALKARDKGNFDVAERRLNEIVSLAGHSAYAVRAARELDAISQRRNELENALKRAGELLAAGKPSEALELYREAARYTGYFQAERARRRAAEIETAFDEAERLRKSYQRAVSDNRYQLAQDIYEKLALRYAGYADIRGLERPVHIVSVPSGATVLLDGKKAGATPLTTMVPGDARILIRVEKYGFRHYEEVLNDPLRRTVSAYLTPKARQVYAWSVPEPSEVKRVSSRLFLVIGRDGTYEVNLGNQTAVKFHELPVRVFVQAEGDAVFADDKAVYLNRGGVNEKLTDHQAGRPLKLYAERLPHYRNAMVIGILGTRGAELLRQRDARRLNTESFSDVKGAALLPQVVVVHSDGELTGLDRSGLRERWRMRLERGLSAGPVPTGTGTTAYIDTDGDLCELNAGTGQYIRKKAIPGLKEGKGTIAALKQGVVLLRGEYVYRLDWETGLVWERTLDRKAVPGLLVTGRDALFTAGKDAFFRLALEDGAVQTKTGWSGRIVDIEVTEEGVLLFATDGEVLSAFLLRESVQ